MVERITHDEIGGRKPFALLLAELWLGYGSATSRDRAGRARGADDAGARAERFEARRRRGSDGHVRLSSVRDDASDDEAALRLAEGWAAILSGLARVLILDLDVDTVIRVHSNSSQGYNYNRAARSPTSGCESQRAVKTSPTCSRESATASGDDITQIVAALGSEAKIAERGWASQP